MVIDTSAIMAILCDEPDAAALERALADDPVRLVSAGTLLECGIVIEARLGDAGGAELDLWLHKLRAEIVDVTAEQVAIARDAFRRYGKGRAKAGLNFGDCFAYALSASRGEPLLFKGGDFSRTDIAAVSLRPSGTK
jgi:ribonuclease VapC